MAEKKLFVYYYSDPDAGTKELRCHAIYTDIEFKELPWHVHTEKPSEDLQDPVWSNETGGWIEADKTSQGAVLAQQNEQIKSLIKANEDYKQQVSERNQQIDDLQNAIQNSNRQNNQLGMQFNAFGAQMTQAMKTVTDAVNKLTEAQKKDGDK